MSDDNVKQQDRNDKSYDAGFKKHYLKPKYWTSWIGILFLGILAFVPAVIRDAVADLLAFLLYRIDIKFKKFVKINLTMAFPTMSEEEKEQCYRSFLRVGLKVIFGYGESFYKSGKYLKEHYLCIGREYLDEALATGKPIIFMAPHAWSIDRCGLYLSANDLKMCTMMHTSKNEVYDWFMNTIRLKYGGKVFERSAGVRAVIRALKDGYSSFFLPDEDLGVKSVVFADFFAAKKATLTTMSKMSKLGNAVVVPMLSTYNEKKHAYEVVFGKMYQNYPSGNDELDAQIMNRSIEELLQGRIEQYMWFLRVYRTRPDTESFNQLYDRKYSYEYIRDYILNTLHPGRSGDAKEVGASEGSEAANAGETSP